MKRINLIVCCIVCLLALYLNGCGNPGSEAMTEDYSFSLEGKNLGRIK